MTHLLTFQPTYVEERGKLNIMKDYDERTIWTSDCLPLMTTYNKGLLVSSLVRLSLDHALLSFH